MAVTFQQETFQKLMPELPEIFYKNWRELEKNHDALPLKVDWNRYLLAEATGKLKILTARENGKLIGYFFLYIDTTAQNTDIKKAASDVVYILPEHRKGTTGWKFIDAVKQFARDLGAKQLYISHKKIAGLAPLLERKGMTLEEEVHTCLL
jgi:GNAT superfamily N-acetyltransferase